MSVFVNGATSLSPSSAVKWSRLLEAGLMLQTEANQKGHTSLTESLHAQYFETPYTGSTSEEARPGGGISEEAYCRDCLQGRQRASL